MTLYALVRLYDPFTMPPTLAKAHSKLDRAIDLLYSKTPFTSDAERVALLFEISRSNTLVVRIDKVRPLCLAVDGTGA